MFTTLSLISFVSTYIALISICEHHDSLAICLCEWFEWKRDEYKVKYLIHKKCKLRIKVADYYSLVRLTS